MSTRTLASPILTWIEDSDASVAVTLTGSLATDDLPSGHFTSPSSLWRFEFLFGTIFMEDLNKVEFADGFIVHGSFNGATPFGFTTPGGFGETYDSFPASSADGIYRMVDDDEYVGDGRILFEGSDFNDFSTWNYTFNVSITNPDYLPATSVPDEGSTANLALFAIASLWMVNLSRTRRVRNPSSFRFTKDV